jgi:hypothetical protein
MLPAGKAISPVFASMCITDSQRTKQFIYGTYLAIQAARIKFPGQTIHLLYAGTGPFATLCLPLTTVFRPDEVQFTLLDIHPYNIQTLPKVFDAFDAGKFVREIVQTDATTYVANEPVHIILTESMAAALKGEPQVALTLHLAPQLISGGFLIPQCITVSAGLLHPQKDLVRMMSFEAPPVACYETLATLLVLNRHTRYPEDFQPVTINIPIDIVDKGYTRLYLFTEIMVFDQVQLLPWASGLTQPLSLTMPQSGRSCFQYLMGEKPGFYEC